MEVEVSLQNKQGMYSITVLIRMILQGGGILQETHELTFCEYRFLKS